MRKKIFLYIAAGAATVVLTVLGMTSSAAERDVEQKENTIIVDFHYIDDYEPQTLYSLEGAEIFQTACECRMVGILPKDTPIKCYQKTNNGFYYGTTDGNQTFYIHEKAVCHTAGAYRKAELVAQNKEADNPHDENGVHFVFNSFGEIDTVILKNPHTNQKIILRGMGMYDYECYDFITENTETISMEKEYSDGTTVKQEFDVTNAQNAVGIYDDGSFGESWIEIDGEFIYNE